MWDAQGVGEVVEFDPAVGTGLAAEEFAADALGEDFGAAAGHGVEAGVKQALQDFLVGDLEALVEVVDFGGGEGLDLDGGALGLDGAEEVLVPLERDGGVVAADDVDFVNVGVDLADDLVDGVLVGVVVTDLGGEVAELAGEDADVGGIDVDVEGEIDAVAGDATGGGVSDATEADQVAGGEAGESIVFGEAFAALGLFPDRFEGRVAKTDGGGGGGFKHVGPRDLPRRG